MISCIPRCAGSNAKQHQAHLLHRLDRALPISRGEVGQHIHQRKGSVLLPAGSRKGQQLSFTILEKGLQPNHHPLLLAMGQTQHKSVDGSESCTERPSLHGLYRAALHTTRVPGSCVPPGWSVRRMNRSVSDTTELSLQVIGPTVPHRQALPKSPQSTGKKG